MEPFDFDNKSKEFLFASGVNLAAGDRVTEGYFYEEPGTVVASVSFDKLFDVLCLLLIALEDNPVAFFLELPCTLDEEEKLRNGDGDPFHYGVYYSDLLHPHGAAALLMRYGEVLLNTGLVTFGFFSNKLQCQITVDSYKVLTLTGMDLGLVERVFAMAKVRKERPVTAWDTISPQTPGTTTGVPVDGKTVYDMLVPLKEDFGVSLDRYEVEGGPVYEVEEVRLPEEMDL